VQPAGDPPTHATASGWVSDLSVPGGAGQVVVNGEVVFPRAGRSAVVMQVRPGDNRVEAMLVEGRGPGMWRFELGSIRGFRPESLRVVAGDAVQASGETVAFRLLGRPGERLVFGFRIAP